ncbi:MAG: hypothetical protein IRY99_06690 [Isosphaeraceae bacterium]|nr:hypothetical protein [Isosphaeraceae bacterium]
MTGDSTRITTISGPKEEPISAGETAHEHADGFPIEVEGEEPIDWRLAEIEMAGEEVAAGWKPAPHPPIAPEVRFLHISRTIHQLVTDRNRSVGIFLFVASLGFGSSTALLNAPERVETIVPLRAIQYWCLPATFGTLAVIGAFTSLILIRTRIGLIFEVVKMNALLGLPAERVKRVNPLSVFFLMHALVVLLGGASAALAAGMLAWHGRNPLPRLDEPGRGSAMALSTGLIVFSVYVGVLLLAYYGTILRATSEPRLQQVRT